jgi:branched-chain amino acid aminotransferase
MALQARRLESLRHWCNVARMASPLPSHVWLNGQIVSVAEARVSPFDHGLLVGDGAFETLITYDGVPFALRRHWERLRFSCETLGIATPEMEMLRRAFREVMAANGLAEARLRATVTSGAGPLGSEKGHGVPTLLVAALVLKPWPATERVVTAPWPRNERGALTGVKSISYADNVRALAHAKTRGGGEALLGNTRDELCEGTGSNVFLVREGEVITPPLESGCLAGVTRALVLKLCAEHGIRAREERLPLSVLRECEEAFLTSSTREVHAISQIDRRDLPRVSGEVTRELARLYKEMVARDRDP